MLNHRDYILDRREVPIVGGEAASQLPYPLNRVEIRAIRRQVFKAEPRLRGFPPLLVQRRVMVACVVGDHDDSPAGMRTDFPEMPQKIEARLGIEASGLTPVNQLAVSQSVIDQNRQESASEKRDHVCFPSHRASPYSFPRTAYTLSGRQSPVRVERARWPVYDNRRS